MLDRMNNNLNKNAVSEITSWTHILLVFIILILSLDKNISFSELAHIKESECLVNLKFHYIQI